MEEVPKTAADFVSQGITSHHLVFIKLLPLFLILVDLQQYGQYCRGRYGYMDS